MARLATIGFECGDVRVEPCPAPASPPQHFAGTPTIDTGTFRSGARSLKLDSSGATPQVVRVPGMPTTSAAPVYHRIYVNFSAFPSSATDRQVFARPSGYGVFVNNTGTVCLQSGGTVIGSRSAALSTGVWYRIELMQNISTAAGADDSGELRIDGVTIASETNVARSTSVSSNLDLGVNTGSVGLVMFMDDLAVNDNTGTDQSSWPGAGKIVLLDPISDNANVGFTGGGGGTTSLFDAVNNKPPTGAASPGTNASQIGDATSSTTDAYSPNLTSYSTAGIVSTDTVMLVSPFHRIATSATTGRSLGLQSTSNPAVTELASPTPALAATAEISATTWYTRSTAPLYLPSVTLGTSPVLRSRKNATTTDRVNVDLMGMYVEYISAAVIPLGTATAVSSATLAVTAPALLALGTAAATSAATLALTAPALLPLGTAAAQSSATLALTVPSVAAARSFDGVDDALTMSMIDQTGAFTIAALVRRTRSGVNDTIVAHLDSGAAVQLNWRFGTTDLLNLIGGAMTARSSTTTVTPADGWVLVAITKAAGTSTPRFHIYKGGVWVHENGAGTQVAPVTAAGGSLLIGTNGTGFAANDLAVVGEWQGTALSDVNVEALATNKATSDWTALAPTAVWELDQASTATPVIDVTGNDFNQTAITGTSVITTGPSPWAYFAQADLTLSTATATSSATLALTAPATVALQTATAQSAATLALTAPALLGLATATASSSATLALSAPAKLTLATAAATSTATLALTAPTKLALATAAATSSATLALTAPTQIPLAAAAAVSTATLSLSAAAKLTLAAAAATSSATLALTAPTKIVLGSAVATSSATLSLYAPGGGLVPLGTAVAQSSATLALTAATRIPLAASAALSSATLALTAATRIPLGSSSATSSATLALTAAPRIPLSNAAASSSAALALTAPTRVPLGPAAALSAATLALTIAGVTVPLGTSTGSSSATLVVTAPTVPVIPLGYASATSDASLVIFIPAHTAGVPSGQIASPSHAGQIDHGVTGTLARPTAPTSLTGSIDRGITGTLERARKT